MLNLIISGCSGRMGQAVSTLCTEDEGINLVAGFDSHVGEQCSYPVYTDPAEFTGKADVVIDFSIPAALPALLSYCKRTKTPIVLCATGYSTDDEERIARAARVIPIFQAGNMSLGAHLLCDLAKRAAQVLGKEFDIELIERHHRMKIDAPSGTALMLLDAVREALPYDPIPVYDRQRTRRERDQQEIGIASIRGGTNMGEHEVIFAGPSEVIELRHAVLSRDVFAKGAITAAKRLVKMDKPGMYTAGQILLGL